MTNAVWPKRDSDLYWVRKDTVADIAALRAVVEHEDNHVRRVEAVDYDYEYSDDSMAVDDGDLYVKPTNVLLADPGRWLKASKGSQHQTLPDLLANPNPHAVTYSQAGASAAIHAAQHGTGQPDEVALDGSQITTGTVALARHPESIENLDKWANGAALDHPEVTVDVDTGVVYCNVEKMGGGNVRVQLGETTLTYTAGRVALSAGTDTVPVKNFCYIWDNGGTATLANVVGDHDSVPGGIEHVPVGEFYVQSAASVNTDGAYKVHVWTDLLAHDNGQSHIKYLNERLRQENASWKEGVATTLALTTNGGSADNVLFSTTVGEVYQLHEHDFPVFATGSDVYVVNQFGTPFDKVTDLNVLLTDALGAAIGNDRRFSLVIWGCVSEDTGDCKLYCNLPNGDYKKDAEAIQDKNRLVVYDIPLEFKGTGFLIAELILKYETAASGTWTEVLTRDLRGLLPSIAAGGGSVQGSEFSDADFRVFDDSDPTADLAFDASAISAGNTRTITMPDKDVDLGGIPASDVVVDAAAFAGNLSPTDTDVQTALDTLDVMSAGGSGPDDWGTDPDMVLTEGGDLRASDTPDLEVQANRYRLWNKSTNGYFANPKDAALTVTAANVGKQKVANVEVPITVDGPPIIHDGAEVDVAGTFDVIEVNAASAKWYPKYATRYVAVRLTDTSGVARSLSSISYRYRNFANLTVRVYVAPDNGSDAPDWAAKTLIGTSPVHAPAVETDYTLTLSGTLPASTATWVIMDINMSLTQDSYVYIVTDGAVLTDLADDLWLKKSTDGTTWANQAGYATGDGSLNSWYGENTQGMTNLAAAGVPAFPAVTADHKIIGTIGDPAGVTIIETTDEVVDSGPAGNSVLLTPAADQYRP